MLTKLTCLAVPFLICLVAAGQPFYQTGTITRSDGKSITGLIAYNPFYNPRLLYYKNDRDAKQQTFSPDDVVSFSFNNPGVSYETKTFKVTDYYVSHGYLFTIPVYQKGFVKLILKGSPLSLYAYAAGKRYYLADQIHQDILLELLYWDKIFPKDWYGTPTDYCCDILYDGHTFHYSPFSELLESYSPYKEVLKEFSKQDKKTEALIDHTTYEEDSLVQIISRIDTAKKYISTVPTYRKPILKFSLLFGMGIDLSKGTMKAAFSDMFAPATSFNATPIVTTGIDLEPTNDYCPFSGRVTFSYFSGSSVFSPRLIDTAAIAPYYFSYSTFEASASVLSRLYHQDNKWKISAGMSLLYSSSWITNTTEKQIHFGDKAYERRFDQQDIKLLANIMLTAGKWDLFSYLQLATLDEIRDKSTWYTLHFFKSGLTLNYHLN